jgi:hypothetical protein
MQTTGLATTQRPYYWQRVLYEASAFLKAGETLALYKTQFDEAVQLLIQEMQRDYAAEYNGGI